MTLFEVLNTFKYTANEIDIKVCYNNEDDEECTFCRTLVTKDKYKDGHEYWSHKVVKFDRFLDYEDILEKYRDFKVTMINAMGKNHFFIFAENFHH